MKQGDIITVLESSESSGWWTVINFFMFKEINSFFKGNS